jgi:hypothetical protein
MINFTINYKILTAHLLLSYIITNNLHINVAYLVYFAIVRRCHFLYEKEVPKGTSMGVRKI